MSSLFEVLGSTRPYFPLASMSPKFEPSKHGYPEGYLGRIMSIYDVEGHAMDGAGRRPSEQAPSRFRGLGWRARPARRHPSPRRVAPEPRRGGDTTQAGVWLAPRALGSWCVSRGGPSARTPCGWMFGPPRRHRATERRASADLVTRRLHHRRLTSDRRRPDRDYPDVGHGPFDLSVTSGITFGRRGCIPDSTSGCARTYRFRRTPRHPFAGRPRDCGPPDMRQAHQARRSAQRLDPQARWHG